MGLLDIFRKGDKQPAAPSPKELARLTRLAGEKMAQDYDRQEAIQSLATMATAEAARGLFRRFDFTMDPSLTDQEEKQSAADGIVAAGEKAIIPLRDYCVRAESLSWPLRILARIVSGEKLIEEVLGILDQFDNEYVRNPEPKIQLISFLEEHPTEDVRVAVEPFLQDVSEPVRFHAATTLFKLGNPASVSSLVAALDGEESLRVKNRIASGLRDVAWAVPEALRATCAAALPERYSLVNERVTDN